MPGMFADSDLQHPGSHLLLTDDPIVPADLCRMHILLGPTPKLHKVVAYMAIPREHCIGIINEQRILLMNAGLVAYFCLGVCVGPPHLDLVFRIASLTSSSRL